MTTQFRNSRGGGYATSAMSRATPPSSNPYAQGYVRQQPQFNPYAYRPPQPVQQTQQPANPIYPPPPQQSYPSPTMDFLQNTMAPQPAQPVTQPPQQSYQPQAPVTQPNSGFFGSIGGYTPSYPSGLNPGMAPAPMAPLGDTQPPSQAAPSPFGGFPAVPTDTGYYGPPNPNAPMVPIPQRDSGLFASMGAMSPGFNGPYDPNVPFSGYTGYNA